MSGYVRSTEFKRDFDGDTVTCTLAPLYIDDMLLLDGTEIEDEKAQEQQRREAVKVLAGIAPKYISDWAGPKTKDGSMVSVEEVCKSAYFLELAVALGNALVAAAHPERPTKPGVPSES